MTPEQVKEVIQLQKEIDELEIIGISQKAIYPDMQNKSQYIKEKYL